MRANPCPVILVDWSDVRDQLRYITLRASITVDGRAVTLYEQAFEYGDYNSPPNTIKHRRALSIPRLGRKVRNHRRYLIKLTQYRRAIREYQRLTHTLGPDQL